MDSGLENRVVIVAAASQGIGRAVAEGFAREGAKLAICSRNQQSIDKAAAEIRSQFQVQVHPEAVDVTQADAIRRFAANVAAKFGRIDVCVTNTGGPPSKPFLELTDDDWHTAFASILMSVVHFARAVIPGMQKQRWGRFITVTSLSVKQPIPNLVLSNTLRAGLMGLVKTMSNEYARDNVLVNNVAPGFTATARQDELAMARAKVAGISPDEIKQRWVADTPLARMAAPREIADAAVWLASERASYVTGQTLTVDGGMYRGL